VVTRRKRGFLLHLSLLGASPAVNQASSPRRHKRRVVFPRGGSTPDVSARQRIKVCPPGAARCVGTEVLEQETGGAVRPCKTNSPLNIGKGSAHSLSFAGKGSAQSEWTMGFARGTSVAKLGQVIREMKDKWRVVFVSPKGMRATGSARHCRCM